MGCNQTITIIYKNCTYKGQVLDEKEHGNGKMTWKNGDVYVGQWENGEISGYGKKTWQNGDMYEGEHIKGKRDGKGTYSYAIGAIYTGQWKDGVKCGNGKHTWNTGPHCNHEYEGEFKDDNPCGTGRRVCPDGSSYHGLFVPGTDALNGRGVYTDPQGTKFEGSWVDLKLVGCQLVTYTNGSQSNDVWENGIRISSVPIVQIVPSGVDPNINISLRNPVMVCACGGPFRNKDALDAHQKMCADFIQNNITRFRCPRCEMLFDTSDLLAIHYSHHNNQNILE